MSKPEIVPPRLGAVLRAAEAAVQALPPAWPLDATVAVNPFLGQADQTLARVAARLGRVAGVRPVMPRAWYLERIEQGSIAREDLEAALAACAEPGRPASLEALLATARAPSPPPAKLATVAELAAERSGVDWPELVRERIGAWAAAFFDRGQALWSLPPGQDAWASWRAWASRDLVPEIIGLGGFAAFVAGIPDRPERALLRAADTLAMPEAALETWFHALLASIAGWAQLARRPGWEAERAGGFDDTALVLLAIRAAFEEALFVHERARIAEAWAAVREAHAAPCEPGPAEIVDAILQEAAERAFQRRLAAALPARAPVAGPMRPALQAVFCIDVRSEPLRRALESLDPGIATAGFAGFFGLPLAHRGCGSDVVEHRLPVLLAPALSSRTPAADEEERRIGARALRAWGRFQKAAVSCFAFVEAAGPLYAGRLLADALRRVRPWAEDPAPVFDPPLPREQKLALARGVLQAMALPEPLAPIVLLVGHGARVANNPHASALACGACGGHHGAESARLLAALLQDPEVRAGLAAEGSAIPEDTLFVAGLHDTTSDRVALFLDRPAPAHGEAIARVKAWLERAGALARAERALALPRASGPEDLLRRGRDWSEVRPEWGLAGCAAFIAAPRGRTRGLALGGRAFLHEYDWRRDPGFSTLELILTAPVVVASWIALQYYGSVVAPALFGGGNKLLHNVVGGIGVLEGNGGDLKVGLPWQSVHDGARLVHEPLRLTVLVEAPVEAIRAVIARHEGLRALLDQRWIHLLALDEAGAVGWRYVGGLAFAAEAASVPARAAA
ncbi:MAG: DUF2309 domain-containing protein [Geminicoccaceae bacterium]|nr:DUF2309 domain-containing protein [Geminicoccaceae bacterium]MDW8368830.1 DUF2309 domain-containing protein [Geminicoccaceae bacterium]